jgi:hypothetical protein
MAEETTPSPAPTPTPTTSTTPPAANTTEARTPEGELKSLVGQAEAQAKPPVEISTKPPTETSAKAPEAYADFKVPEGYKLDADLVKEVTPLFKEMGLTQDAAQKLVDAYNKQAIAIAKRNEESVTQMRTEWRTEVGKDSELGPKLETVKADIGKALQIISRGDDSFIKSFRQAMDLTGAGDNPAIIRGFYRMAQHFVEGTPVAGSGPSPAGQTRNGEIRRPSAAAAMYPNLPTSSNN